MKRSELGERGDARAHLGGDANGSAELAAVDDPMSDGNRPLAPGPRFRAFDVAARFGKCVLYGLAVSTERDFFRNPLRTGSGALVASDRTRPVGSGACNDAAA